MLAVFILLVPFLCISCAAESGDGEPEEQHWTRQREAMVDVLRRYGVKDARILEAMGKVRRHVYIPKSYRRRYSAYGDHPCPIGHGQTISQPFIVAYMTEKMKLQEGEKVLEIGTGSGYQAAVLAAMGVEVYSIEIVPELAEHARKVLDEEGHDGVKVLTGDGYKGWPEHGPFDAIIVTCAPSKVPQALVDQLKEGGRMILPLGAGIQRLVILRKKGGRVEQEDDIGVRFVPMVRGRGRTGS